jgi:hypothetical protein
VICCSAVNFIIASFFGVENEPWSRFLTPAKSRRQVIHRLTTGS